MIFGGRVVLVGAGVVVRGGAGVVVVVRTGVVVGGSEPTQVDTGRGTLVAVETAGHCAREINVGRTE